MSKVDLKQTFNRIMGDVATAAFFAPGRVNLIGEHIDYNGGKVLPCAINLGTYATVRKRTDSKIRFYSMNFESDGIIEVDVNDMTYNKSHTWANYPKGVIDQIQKQIGVLLTGFDVVFYGNIPNRSGLSSSASISILTTWIVRTLFDLELSRVACAQIVQRSENEYIGVSTGIMDQFVIAHGKQECALLLDTAHLEFEYEPFAFDDAVLLIMNTNKKRELVDSAYNTRWNECEKVLGLIQTQINVPNLCALNLEQLTSMESIIHDEILFKRARHVVTENQRTYDAVEALRNHDAALFGSLMNASHASLRDDYEVTGLELDTLVQSAQELQTTYGARVTGAGFGGCAIALIHKDAVEETIKTVGSQYNHVIGYDAGFYRVAPSDGVNSISLDALESCL